MDDKKKEKQIVVNGREQKEQGIMTKNDDKQAESVAGDGDWDSLYDDKGECLLQNLEKLSLGGSTNKKTEEPATPPTTTTTTTIKKIDYLKFEPKAKSEADKEEDESSLEGEFNDSKYAHIVEIYDFPVTFKNENIINAFKDEVGNQNFSLKWVDDTHCLAIFSTVSDATQALRLANPMVKARSIGEASVASREMAKKKIESLRPYKARPQTSSLVASKLIGASLGLKGNLMSKEKVEMERNKLKEAKEKRRNDKDLKDAAWNGDL